MASVNGVGRFQFQTSNLGVNTIQLELLDKLIAVFRAAFLLVRPIGSDAVLAQDT